ncbi:ArsR/SmtB family transcription factor [Marilutibacter aestuarii]|nr:metalloregulator ArsR/SmtB family transcription factor [Lysobacter aestuarii]
MSTGVLDLERMQVHAADASTLLRTLGNPQRLMILCHLVEGELGVGELHARLALSQSALSQHLAVLREAGIVDTRREGVQVFYRLQPGPAQQVMATLHDIYCGPSAR